MKANREEYRMSPMETVLKYFTALMSVAYIMVGLAMVLRSDGLFDIARVWALPMGSMLMVYGIYRGYRLYQKYFQA
jgi:hypothetical protein